MTRTSQRLILLYLALLVGLGALGAENQRLYKTQWALIKTKAERQVYLSDLRSRAAAVKGPLAVREWALSKGMVSSPEGQLSFEVAPVAPPSLPQPTGGLEIQTLWR